MRYYTDIIDVGKRKLPTGRQIMDSSRYFLKNPSGDYLLIEGKRIIVGKRSFAQVCEVPSELSVLLIRGQFLLRSNQPQKEIASLSYKYEVPLFLSAAGGE